METVVQLTQLADHHRAALDTHGQIVELDLELARERHKLTDRPARTPPAGRTGGHAASSVCSACAPTRGASAQPLRTRGAAGPPEASLHAREGPSELSVAESWIIGVSPMIRLAARAARAAGATGVPGWLGALDTRRLRDADPLARDREW